MKNFLILPSSLIQDVQLSDSAFRLYSYLLYKESFFNKVSGGVMRESVPTISKNLGWYDRKVQKVIKELESSGYVRVIRRKDDSGCGNLPNQYVCNVKVDDNKGGVGDGDDEPLF